jgi:hypothetical protein
MKLVKFLEDNAVIIIAALVILFGGKKLKNGQNGIDPTKSFNKGL